jgi:hypothetical protein
VTPHARAAFELLRFTAAPVGDAFVILDVEGRFGGATGRFARRPHIVVERGAEADRLELAPVHVDVDRDRWRAAYAVPVAAMDGARFGIALRGTLLELPEPDRVALPAATEERSALLAREANALRRELEQLEERAAGADARAAEADERARAAEAHAQAAERRAAVAEERAEVLQRAVRELEQRVLAAEEEAAATQERAAAAEERAAAADERAATAEERATAADERAAAAEERAVAAERRAELEASGLAVLRAELAEERDRARRAGQEESLAEEAFEDEDDDVDEDPYPTPPRGIVARPRSTPSGAHAAGPVRDRHGPGPERWLAVIALLVLVAVVVALALDRA